MSQSEPTEPRESDRTGLVLAAGFGARQTLEGEAVPKPLIPVAGRALILRTMDGLQAAGCSRVVVVLGHRADQIRRFLDDAYDGPLDVIPVMNDEYRLGNGVSVLAARQHLPDDFVLSMADHVFDPQVMDLVARHQSPPNGSALVVDSKLDSILDLDDATKVLVRESKVTRIGKGLTDFNAVDCGLFLANDALLEALNGLYSRNGDVSLSEGVQVLATEGRMAALDLGKARWQDVDTKEMLSAAERLLPAESLGISHPSS